MLYFHSRSKYLMPTVVIIMAFLFNSSAYSQDNVSCYARDTPKVRTVICLSNEAAKINHYNKADPDNFCSGVISLPNRSSENFEMSLGNPRNRIQCLNSQGNLAKVQNFSKKTCIESGSELDCVNSKNKKFTYSKLNTTQSNLELSKKSHEIIVTSNQKQSQKQSRAAVQLVCAGQSAEAGKRAFAVDCSDRNAVINAVQSAWLTLRKNNIGGSLENMCFEALTSAKDLHPSISFVGISDSFFMRCNMGLEYVK